MLSLNLKNNSTGLAANTLVERNTCAIRSHLVLALKDFYLFSPNKVLINDSAKTMTYGEAYIRSLKLHNTLKEQYQLDKDDWVCVITGNNAWFPLVLSALELIACNLIVYPNDNVYVEVDDFLDHSKLKMIFTDNEKLAEHISETLHFENVVVLQEYSQYKTIKDLSKLGEISTPEKHEGNDVLSISLLTSGSTGKPKIIILNAHSFVLSSTALAKSIEINRKDKCFIPVPFFHTFGIVAIYSSILSQASIITLEKYKVHQSLDMQSENQATAYFGVPTMYIRELKANSQDDWSLSSLCKGVIAGSYCPPHLFEEYESKYRCKLVQSYGMTETSATLTSTQLYDSLEVRAQTVGKPIAGVEVKIGDLREIYCKSPALYIYYIDENGVHNPKLDSEGWFHTGDVGRFDKQNNLVIEGRLKDMIIRGGINIFPSEIENAYSEHPDIMECCVIPYPDEELGERTCLCVHLREDKESAYDLRQYAHGRIAKQKIPDLVLKFDSFPHLASGKLDKKLIQTSALEQINSIRKES